MGIYLCYRRAKKAADTSLACSWKLLPLAHPASSCIVLLSCISHCTASAGNGAHSARAQKRRSKTQKAYEQCAENREQRTLTVRGTGQPKAQTEVYEKV